MFLKSGSSDFQWDTDYTDQVCHRLPLCLQQIPG